MRVVLTISFFLVENNRKKYSTTFWDSNLFVEIIFNFIKEKPVFPPLTITLFTPIESIKILPYTVCTRDTYNRPLNWRWRNANSLLIQHIVCVKPCRPYTTHEINLHSTPNLINICIVFPLQNTTANQSTCPR